MRPLQTGFGLQLPVAYALYTGGEEGWGPWGRGGMGAMGKGSRKQRLEGEERGGVREEERRNERKRRKHNLLIGDCFPTKSNRQLQFGVKIGLQSETEISAHLFVSVSRFSRA